MPRYSRHARMMLQLLVITNCTTSFGIVPSAGMRGGGRLDWPINSRYSPYGKTTKAGLPQASRTVGCRSMIHSLISIVVAFPDLLDFDDPDALIHVKQNAILPD